MKYKRVAVHREDLDGISCAALILRKAMLEGEEPPEILFLSIREVMEYPETIDLAADLPKGPNVIRNVDHHDSNYQRLLKEGRLTEEDAIDPKAPSAAQVLKTYLGLDGDPIAEEIVEMANITDTGGQTEETIPASKIISVYRKNPDVLLRLAWALAKYGKRYLQDEEIRKLRESIKKDREDRYAYLDRKLSELSNRAKRLILYVSEVPSYARFDIPRLLFSKGAELVALLYNTEHGYRLSLRSAGPSVRYIAEALGGGGHEQSAGALIGKDEKRLLETIGFIAKERGDVLYSEIKKPSDRKESELESVSGDLSVRYYELFVTSLSRFF